MNLFLVLTILASFIFLFGLKDVKALDSTAGNDEAAQNVLNTFYHNGEYVKTTKINLTDPAKAEVVKMFHASCNHLERITYYNDEEIWMTNNEGTINSGYETVDGDMKHFKKVDGVNVYDYTVENTITTEYYQTLKNLRETTGWQLKDNAYINDHTEVIDQFRQFVAPLWLATEEARNYIVLTSVKMFEVEDKLHLQLLTSTTDSAKVTNGEVFAEAIVSIERPVVELGLTKIYAYANNFTHIETSVDIKEESNIVVTLTDEEGNVHSGSLFVYIMNWSQYHFPTYNKVNTGNYTLDITYYAKDAIYIGTAVVRNANVITLDGYKTEKINEAKQMPASLELTENLYDEINWAQIQLLVSNAESAISAASSFTEVDQVLVQLEIDLLAVEQKDLNVSELIQIYHDKVDKELDKVIPSDYSLENYTLITNKAVEIKEQISLRTLEDDMNALVSEFTSYITTIEKLAIQLSTDGCNFNPHGGTFIIVGWNAVQLSVPGTELNDSVSKSDWVIKLITIDGDEYNGTFICQDGAAAAKLHFPTYGDAGHKVEDRGYTIYFKFTYNNNVYEVVKTA